MLSRDRSCQPLELSAPDRSFMARQNSCAQDEQPVLLQEGTAASGDRTSKSMTPSPVVSCALVIAAAWLR